jgi:hypothetical protein
MFIGLFIGIAVLVLMALGAGTLFILFMIPSWCVGAALLLQRWTSGRAVVRLRMNAAGMVQDDNAEAPPWAENARRLEIWIPMAFTACLLAWGLAKPNWVALALAAILAGNVLWRIRQHWVARRALLQLPDGHRLTRTSRRDILKPCPWPEVLRFEVRPIGQGRFRIVATSTDARRTSPDGDAADIELACTREQANRLAERVSAWRDHWRKIDILAARNRISGRGVIL